MLQNPQRGTRAVESTSKCKITTRVRTLVWMTDEKGQIIAEQTTAVSESDIKYLETALKKANLPEETPVYADKGYNSTENKEVFVRMKLKRRIMDKGTMG